MEVYEEQLFSLSSILTAYLPPRLNYPHDSDWHVHGRPLNIVHATDPKIDRLELNSTTLVAMIFCPALVVDSPRKVMPV